MGSKSKTNLMKSYEKIKKEAGLKLKKQKKENALDIISKSLQKNINENCPKGSGSALINLKSFIMSTLKNHVQLIGNVGQEPQITNLESGKKVARFSLATNEYYKNAKGEKVQSTEWHTVVAWGKTAEIVEKYAGKGKEIGVSGKLKNRSYEDNDGIKRYVTEVEANEILLLGTKNGDSTAE